MSFEPIKGENNIIGYLGVAALLMCAAILSLTYQETYKFLFFFDRTRDARLRPDLISGLVAVLVLFVLWKSKAFRQNVSQPVMACLILLFLYVCAALAAGIIKGTSSAGFFRIGSDILTAGRYWPVLVVIAVLMFSAVARRQYMMAILVSAAILVVFNLSPVSDAMGLVGFAFIVLFAAGFYALVDLNVFRSALRTVK